MALRRQQNSDAPCEGLPHLTARERERSDWWVVKILAVLALFVGFGLWFWTRDKEMVSPDGTVVTAPPSPRDPDARIKAGPTTGSEQVNR